MHSSVCVCILSFDVDLYVSLSAPGPFDVLLNVIVINTAIDKDACAHWFISRVRARLNNFRVPVGSKGELTDSLNLILVGSYLDIYVDAVSNI